MYKRQSKRSAAEQIEYWASLGRSIADEVDPDKLLAVSAGLAQVKIVPIVASAIDPSTVFAMLESDRKSGYLANKVHVGDAQRSAAKDVRYQASQHFPGLLEKIDAAGEVTVGEFVNGKFVAHQDKAS